YEGEVTAREARALGIHWVFFPVADVNNNPDNPIINIRSYGENPQDVAAYDSEFIAGAHSDPANLVLTTAKHFPGHGDTATDSHMNMATITGGRQRLSEVEFVPFRACIQKGVDAVMTAHIAVPALEEADVPATLSRVLLTKVLREELGFRGIIVTDALEMHGIANGFSVGDAAVRSIEAGADVLLMPPDPEAAINAVVAAVHGGRLTQKRIEQSVMRVLSAKVKLGLPAKRLVNLDAVDSIINSPESNARAQQIADRAVTLIKNKAEAVPLRDPSKTCFMILTESRSAVMGQALAQEIHRRTTASVAFVDNSMPDIELNQAAQQTSACGAVVVAAFASVAAYRGDVALGGGFPALLTKLIASGKPMVLVALGNPYLLRNFPEVSAYLTTYSTVPPSEIAAVKALFGEIAVDGKLPITIPGIANYGDGIHLDATVKNAPAASVP
ncbi:MAG: glycoside hydrolase family 3 C-terminal domain-containing protein, partial [Acidobacteriota bacterium]|nr:glycoside hydrolase family 3 C-terminal domain-containing protein [Acidobacteriota bacterium]